MESIARLTVVALVSLALGFFVNEALERMTPEANASEIELGADVAPVLVGPLLPEPAVPVPVPELAPMVSYRIKVEAPAEPEVAAEIEVLEQSVDDPGNLASLAIAQIVAELAAPAEAQATEADYVAALRHEGSSVDEGFDALEAGTLTRLTWWAGESLYGSSIPTPVLVAEGTAPGPTLCLTAAVHGDELNGIETVRQVMYTVNPAKLSGRVIGVPIVNLQGFERHSRYLPDRRDLNRFFPGNARGSSASRIAHSFFEKVLRRCDALVDLHTGSFHRTNLPQLRANLEVDAVVEITKGFGSTVILHSAGSPGTLRGAAVAAGIPTVTLEAGEPLRVDAEAVAHSVNAIYTLLDTMGMYSRRSFWGNPEPTYYRSLWVRADNGGILVSQVKLGKRVRSGDALGTVTDPITNSQQQIVAPSAGRVIGMALNQFVMPGYAAFHIGIESPTHEGLPDDLENTHTDMDQSVARFEDLTNPRDDSEE